MDLLLILTYTAICVVIFKIFRIPLNKWSVPTAVLGGVILIGALIFAMNYNHPFSEVSRTYFVTTPIVAPVRGIVVEVPVKGNLMLKKGDVLFKIDPVPYQNKVASLKAQLTSAKLDFDRAKQLLARGAVAQRDYDQAKALVDRLTPELAAAEYDVERTTVTAPEDGYVIQMMARPGLMAVPMPLRPLMVFVPYESHRIVGWFRQNSLLRLVPGDEAEVTYDGLPGQVFKGKVEQVMPVMAEGQVQASGNLIALTGPVLPGRVPVVVVIDDPAFEQYADKMPGGSFGQVAVYSEHFHHVAIMRKILLRMASWMNYLFPFH
ncbi:MAG TPA: biotin/lipoyl-binding protein [Dongiaceae bacterium]|nr:biotin/lipoyl-binding protein [Dongiaceae bacterium]